MVIDWLKEASVSAVVRQLGLSWNAVDRIKQHAVRRGLARRERGCAENLCVDETSFKKRHEYVTVISDHDAGTVLHVAEGRKKSSLSGWYEGLGASDLEAIKSVSMDMWPAYINSTLQYVPGASAKISFDRFHVAKHLGGAVDKVRRAEHKALLRVGDGTLKGSKYKWLQNPANMSVRNRREFKRLRDSSLKTARAWAIKDLAMSLWCHVSRVWAGKAWKKWLGWALRCQLDPMVKAAKMVRDHLWGIINAIILKVSNGPAESINSRIRMVKIKGRGFRNRQRFINDIYFHLGGLDLYPDGARQ